jgi:NAD-dependent oxidoreductase involved in siderophore biosynthesis
MRTAVIGVGYLGRFHAQKYAALADSTLVGIADPSERARNSVGAELGVPAYAEYRELLGKVDAVSIVTPTPSHYETAKAFLEAGAHVLVEKPMRKPKVSSAWRVRRDEFCRSDIWSASIPPCKPCSRCCEFHASSSRRDWRPSSNAAPM